MEIQRNGYLQQLIFCQWNGFIKVITGIRRCGKSYLLKTIYQGYLLKHGVKQEQIIVLELDLAKDMKYRNPLEFSSYVRSIVEGKKQKFYLFVDEIQMSESISDPNHPERTELTCYDVINDLHGLQNLDIYVTGSNSKMLSSDIMAEFRGKSKEIRVHPLSFSEYYSAVGGDQTEAFDRYVAYGGIPSSLLKSTDDERMDYLQELFTEVYFKDIVERRGIEHQDALEQIFALLSSPDDSLASLVKIANILNEKREMQISDDTIKSYIAYLEDSFLFSRARRYDVRKKAYLDAPYKYYCADMGLRAARIGFTPAEMPHIMETIAYYELLARGCSVKVGVFSALRAQNDSICSPREIGLVVTSGSKKAYLQFVDTMGAKERSELHLLSLIGDSYPKIVVRRDIGRRWYDDKGILNINVIEFLLDKKLV